MAPFAQTHARLRDLLPTGSIAPQPWRRGQGQAAGPALGQTQRTICRTMSTTRRKSKQISNPSARELIETPKAHRFPAYEAETMMMMNAAHRHAVRPVGGAYDHSDPKAHLTIPITTQTANDRPVRPLGIGKGELLQSMTRTLQMGQSRRRGPGPGLGGFSKLSASLPTSGGRNPEVLLLPRRRLVHQTQKSMALGRHFLALMARSTYLRRLRPT